MRTRFAVAVTCAVIASCTSAHLSDGARVRVFAAASLTDAFNELGRSSPVGVEFTFAGTPALLGQLRDGAPADVLATADEENMRKAIDGGLVTGATVLARNRLAIVVPAGNPAHVTGVADLARPGLKVALCAPEVPAGRYARQMLERAQVAVTPVTEEANVKAVVSKASLGEIDAGVVYVTDVKAAGAAVTEVGIPDAVNVMASYEVAMVASSKNKERATAFISFARGEVGRRVLADNGFDVVT